MTQRPMTLRPPPWHPPDQPGPTLDRVREALAARQARESNGTPDLRPAAVLLALCPGPHGLEVLLTRRSHEVADHQGQVAFPGGAVDPGDRDSLAAALREAWEEVGLPPERAQVLGRLDDFPTITGFLVTPWIVQVPSLEGVLPATGEVDAVFPFPLIWLADDRHVLRVPWRPGGVPMEVLFIPYGEFLIWGATARILWQFWEVIR